jgi:shikimate dehydrogenase
VLGSGGTAPRGRGRPGAGLGVTELVVAARNPQAAARLVELGSLLGMASSLRDPNRSDDLRAAASCTDVLVSTIPADAAANYADALAAVPVLLDAIYNPWPTPLAQAVTTHGGEVISGLQMLLHQAFAQVEQFTGRHRSARADGGRSGLASGRGSLGWSGRWWPWWAGRRRCPRSTCGSDACPTP